MIDFGEGCLWRAALEKDPSDTDMQAGRGQAGSERSKQLGSCRHCLGVEGFGLSQ